MSEFLETVIIGGGQAGLSLSYYLQGLGREHIVLENTAQPGDAWRNQRWDSFTLVTPNWTFLLPGAEYHGDDPHGFMPWAEIVNRFDAYVQDYHLPVRYETQVTSVEPADHRGYRVSTQDSTLQADNVVVATGLFQNQKSLPSLHTSPLRSTRSTPVNTARPKGYRRARCWWSAAANLAARSPRSCTSLGAKYTCVWVALGGCRAAIAGGIPSSG